MGGCMGAVWSSSNGYSSLLRRCTKVFFHEKKGSVMMTRADSVDE